ncbi:MAG: AI-2E family transporter [Candidatus Giovannonibacteria bacterium]|nr:MAG: AI-2E family transporter [Candidatus Giovannonibacteria bacterium]
MPQKNQIIEISFWTMLKAALLVLLLWALWLLRDFIAVLLLSIVIASAIEPANHFFARYRAPRVLSVVFIYLAAFLTFALVFYLIVPPLFGDILEFLSALPAYIEGAVGPRGTFFLLFPEIPQEFSKFVAGAAVSIEEYIIELAPGVFSAGTALFGGILSLVLLIVISFYLSVQEHGIENFLRVVTPLEDEEYILDLWRRSQRKIGRWLQGQILLGVLVGVMVFLGLTILNVKYAISLAILAAIFEIIPVFGPVMAAIPAVAIAFIQAPLSGLMVLGLFIIVQQFENHLIYPLVVRKTIGVPPLLVVISLVVGGTLGGFYGIILSVPIASVLVEFLNDVAAKKARPR